MGHALSLVPQNSSGGESVPNLISWQASQVGTTGNEVNPMHRLPSALPG